VPAKTERQRRNINYTSLYNTLCNERQSLAGWTERLLELKARVDRAYS